MFSIKTDFSVLSICLPSHDTEAHKVLVMVLDGAASAEESPLGWVITKPKAVTQVWSLHCVSPHRAQACQVPQWVHRIPPVRFPTLFQPHGLRVV